MKFERYTLIAVAGALLFATAAFVTPGGPVGPPAGAPGASGAGSTTSGWTPLAVVLWATTGLFAVPLSVLGATVVYGGLFALTSFMLAACTAFWYLRGALAYGGRRLRLVLAVPLAPLVTVVHSTGTVLGILDPPDGFRVTRKVGPGGGG